MPLAGKVLVVDDTKINQQVTLLMLEDYNLDIKLADNGCEALEKVKDEDYDLIFMDCLMPEMDGFECTRQIRQLEDERKNKVPIIALTASVTAECKEQCQLAGMNDYITKPFSPEILEDTLNRWLGDTAHPAESTETEAQTSEPLYDIERCRKLQKILGARFQQFLFNYFKESEDKLTELKHTPHDKPEPEMERLVHSLKSGAANFGSDPFTQYAQEVENRYRAHDYADADKEIEQLDKMFSELKAALSTLVDE